MKGIIASEGYAIGKAVVIKAHDYSFEQTSKLTVEEELNRFENAKINGIGALNFLKEKTKENVGEHEAEVFEAHKQLLMDPVLAKQVQEHIEGGLTAEHSFDLVVNSFILQFEALDNAYMRERALDLKDIRKRILNLLLDIEENDVAEGEHIVVAYDLTPSETAKLDTSKTLGFLTEIGGETSHSAIIARTLNLPAVVGVKDLMSTIAQDDVVVINGMTGEVIINPSQALLEDYKEKMNAYQEAVLLLNQYKHKASITKDGKAIEIACNIANVSDIDAVIESTADGIGLFRSEFLYMNRSQLPSEEEQFQAYKAVLEGMKDKPVTIRTMDIGGDKQLSYLDIEEEMNPFLGYRAIRICLEDVELFKTQLRALLKASAYGHLRIMFPMIASLEELLEAKEILKACEKSLYEEGYEIGQYEVGIMIEVPAAAMIADILAEEVDFFSIGTNDLIQYTTAVDRMNSKIADLYSPYHPAVIRLLHRIITIGKSKGIEVGMCGNVAGYPDFIPFLLNCGIDELSMSPNAVLKARSIVNEHKNTSVDDLLNARTKAEVKGILTLPSNI